MKKKNRSKTLKLSQYYGLLIILIVANGFLLYLKFVFLPDFQWIDFFINIAVLFTIAISYFRGRYFAAIVSFFYIVWYTVWLATYAAHPMWIDYLRLFLIPTMAGIAGYIHDLQAETLNVLKNLKKFKLFDYLDDTTGIMNMSALNHRMQKQFLFKEREASYRYGLVIFRFDFLDFIRDELGIEAYYKIVHDFILKIEKHNIYSDDLFWCPPDSIMISVPFYSEEIFKTLIKTRDEFLEEYSRNYNTDLFVRYAQITDAEIANIFSEGEITDVVKRLRYLSEEDIANEYIR